MGWFGNGKYDGDGTATVQMMIVEKAGFTRNIPLANGKTLYETLDWYVGKENLANKVVNKVFSEWSKIEKFLSHPKTIKGNLIFNENSAIDYMMAADFFINHKHPLPLGLKEKATLAVNHLIYDGHADDFRDPSYRKKVLKSFLKKLEDFPELSDPKIDLFVCSNPKNPDYLTVLNVLNKDINLKEGDEINQTLIKKDGYSGYSVMNITTNTTYGNITAKETDKSAKKLKR